ncbi:uncharacterized protein LTHEOB_13051 [Lasiodiplodia theobromae]|uniref:uncharacterized protein n=1 Tax=Lasiodiplodia theobromae TaxID=45133 RepID=UPI0015C35C1B|nr:uncharacterized protein LTHEOB_13051 [Lasiodiplodia theobromae]KAF4545814.1 hypothetical protein LTHEOB_13051 [Lasiodiplodia theobromae]
MVSALDLVHPRRCVNERVLAAWSDRETGQQITLGSLSLLNKESSFALECAHDDGCKHAMIRFSLAVKLRLAGHSRSKDVSLEILPSSSPEIQVDTCKIQDVGAVASAAHDAGLSDSGMIIRAHFTLERPGRLLMPELKTTAKPSSRTARDLLQNITSLSKALSFFVYLRPSDYAREGLRLVSNTLRSAVPGKENFPQDALGESGHQVTEPPPQYRAHMTVIPRSPSQCATTPLPESLLSVLSPNTVPQTPPFRNPGPAAPSAGDPTEDRLRAHLTVELGLWLGRAVAVNLIAYQDERINPLRTEMGRHARAGDEVAFWDARARCSAAFFLCHGPAGRENVDDFFQTALADAFLRDLTRLIAWVLEQDRRADLTMWDELMTLGEAARASDLNRYHHIKGMIIGCVTVQCDPEQM